MHQSNVSMHVIVFILLSLLLELVMVPLDLPEKGLAASNFGMLGLGDIVIPGKYRVGFEKEKERFSPYYL